MIQKTLLCIALAMGALSAHADETVMKVDGFFDPSTADHRCTENFLGEDSQRIVQFETDGRIKVQLEVKKNDSGSFVQSKIRVNHKAFVPYFDFDKTPVPFPDGPQLVNNVILGYYLPSLSSTGKFVLVGYGVPWVRTQSEVKMGQNSLTVDYLLESAYSEFPEPQDIRQIRTAHLQVTEDKIAFQVVQKYSDGDPEIPKYYKTTAHWTRDISCEISRN